MWLAYDMTPEDAAVVVACSRNARNMVKRSVGFFDDDLAQDACEAMIRAVGTYDPKSGATLSTWVMTKGKWNIIDQYRNRTKIRNKGWQPSTSLEQMVDQQGGHAFGQPDRGYERVEDLLEAVQTLKTLPYTTTLAGFSLRNQHVIRDVMEHGETQYNAGQHVDPPMDESQVSQLMKKFRERLRGMSRVRPRKGP